MCIIFLGILIDTIAGQLRRPPEKLSRLRGLLQEWGDRKSSMWKEQESLVGHLNHACKVVRSGRSFLRHMFDSHSSARMQLSRGFHSDLAWWQEIVLQRNGVSFLLPPSHLPQLDMSSDVSGSWGCGAWHQSRWLQVQWGPQSQSLSIAEKELVPIILACDLWGQAWQGRRVRCHCDNQVLVACLCSRMSKNKGLMHLLRCLVFVMAQHQCHLVAEYIDTKSNHLADDLSRNRAYSFLFKVPEADHHPSPVSLPLLSRLLDRQADWTSPTWRRQFWRYLQAGLAPSTQKTYQSAMHRFHNFCTTYNVTSPFPLTEQLLCTYASYLADQQHTPQTIKSYLSALRSWQISLGLPDPKTSPPCPCSKGSRQALAN